MTIAHAVAAYWVSNKTGLADETMLFEYRIESLAPNAEETIASMFAEERHSTSNNYNGEHVTLAITHYAITIPDETAADSDLAYEFLDNIEWELDFRDPAVRIVRQNDAAAQLFIATTAHLATLTAQAA